MFMERIRTLVWKVVITFAVAAPIGLLFPSQATAGTGNNVPCEAIGESLCCRCPTSNPVVDCAMISGPGNRECTTTLCDPITCGLWD